MARRSSDVPVAKPGDWCNIELNIQSLKDINNIDFTNSKNFKCSVIFDQSCWLPKEGLAQPFLTRLKLNSPIGRNIVNGQPPILELLFDALSLNVSWSISVGLLSGLDFGLTFQVVLLLLLPSFLGLAQFGWATTNLLLFIRLLVGNGTCRNSCRIKLVANAFNLRKEVSSVSSEPKTNEPL